MRVLVRNPERAAKLQRMANVEIILGDLSQADSLRGCAKGCSQVYHCAAKLSGSNWKASHAVNVTGTRALINEAVHSGVERFIYTSTIGVYGLSDAQNITEEFPWSECNLPYVATKQEAELLVRDAAAQIPVVIARLGDVFGPSQYGFTVGLIEKINRGQFACPVEKDSGILNPVYIDNLLDALLLMGTHPAAMGETFNVVDGAPIRVRDFIRRLAAMAGKKVPELPAAILKGVAGILMVNDLLRRREALITPGTMQLLFLRKSTINADKICTVLGWKPAIEPEEAFRCTEQWLSQEGYIPCG